MSLPLVTSLPPGDMRGSFCIEEIPRESGLVIFGASGDLTSRKLVPALFSLYRKNRLPQGFFLVGCARSAFREDEFRARLAAALRPQAPSGEVLADFLERCFYLGGDYRDAAPVLAAGRQAGRAGPPPAGPGQPRVLPGHPAGPVPSRWSQGCPPRAWSAIARGPKCGRSSRSPSAGT